MRTRRSKKPTPPTRKPLGSKSKCIQTTKSTQSTSKQTKKCHRRQSRFLPQPNRNHNQRRLLEQKRHMGRSDNKLEKSCYTRHHTEDPTLNHLSSSGHKYYGREIPSTLGFSCTIPRYTQNCKDLIPSIQHNAPLMKVGEPDRKPVAVLRKVKHE